MSNPVKSNARYFAELLEPRRLLSEGSAITITGTESADVIQIEMVGANLKVTVNGNSSETLNASIATILVDALGGTDTIYLEANGGHGTTIQGGAGADLVYFSFAFGKLENIAGEVLVDAGADGGRLDMYDSSDATAVDYDVTSTTLTRSAAFGGVSFIGLTTINLFCTAGANNITISSTPEGSLGIRGQSGNDHFKITPESRFLDDLGGSLSCSGGLDDDVIEMFDNANSRSDVWTLSNSALDRAAEHISFNDCENVYIQTGSGSESISLANVQQPFLKIESGPGIDYVTLSGIKQTAYVEVFGGDDDDTFNIEDVASNPNLNEEGEVRFFGGAGDDSMLVSTLAKTLKNIRGPIHFSGDAGSDSLEFFDQSPDGVGHSLINIDYVRTSVAFNPSYLYYSSNESLRYNAPPDTAIVEVHSTPPGMSTTIIGGSDFDIISIGSSNQLSTVMGPVTVAGRGGDDVLILNDSARATNASYSLTDTQLTGPGISGISFNEIESTALRTGQGTNTVTVTNVSAAIEHFVVGGSSKDSIFVPRSVKAVRIEGGGSLDDIVIDADGGPHAVARIEESDEVAMVSVAAGSALTLDADVTLGTRAQSINGAVSFSENSTYIAHGAVNLPAISLTVARNLTRNGYANGAWNGATSAFNSPYAATSLAGDGVGYISAEALGLASYNGVVLGESDTIFSQTLYGDANLSRTVDFSDLLKVGQSYGSTGIHWFNGDFSFDQSVGFPDLLRLGQNYGLTNLQTSMRGGCLIQIFEVESRALKSISK